MGTLSDSPLTRQMMQFDWRFLHAAIMFAQAKHAGQVDKGDEPYFWHPFRVGSSLLPDTEAAALGILHDVLEDTDATPEEVRMFLQVDEEFLADLDALTHRKDGETYGQYLDRVKARPRALKVKLADIADNLDERRLERAAFVRGVDWAASKKLKYELALCHLGGTKVITFCAPEHVLPNSQI